MNLTVSLAAAEKAAHRLCAVGALLDRLDTAEPDQAAILRSALADESLPWVTIARALARDNVHIQPKALARHSTRQARTRECGCS